MREGGCWPPLHPPRPLKGEMLFQALLWVWFPPRVQDQTGHFQHCAVQIAAGWYRGQCSSGAPGCKGRGGNPPGHRHCQRRQMEEH